MARRPRIDLIGYHHVSNQGVHKANLFATMIEKEEFLDMVCKACDIYDIVLHDYSIMDNHYHLLIETRRENLSYFMRQINGNYAIHYNKKLDRGGPVWRGRYKSWYLMHEEYLDYTIKYIEYDPIKANVTFFPGDYPYTLSGAIFGQATVPSCSMESILIQKYDKQELIEFLGSDLTRDELGALEDEKRKKITIEKKGVKLQRDVPLGEYFKDITSKQDRNLAMKKAYEDGYTQGQIAKHLNVTTALVSYSIKKLSESKSS